MKKQNLLFFCTAILFLSACTAGVKPTDSVGFGAAFSHLVHDTNYIKWAILGQAMIIGYFVYSYLVTANKEIQDETMKVPFLVLVFGTILIWIAPASVLSISTVEQVLKGNWGI